MIPAAAISAVTVAAVGETRRSTRENPNKASPITASAASGIRIGSRMLSRGSALAAHRVSPRPELRVDVSPLQRVPTVTFLAGGPSGRR